MLARTAPCNLCKKGAKEGLQGHRKDQNRRTNLSIQFPILSKPSHVLILSVLRKILGSPKRFLPQPVLRIKNIHIYICIYKSILDQTDVTNPCHNMSRDIKSGEEGFSNVVSSKQNMRSSYTKYRI